MYHTPPLSILFRALLTLSLTILLVTVFSTRLPAAEPVVVRVEGVEGDPLKNVEAALVLPTGLIKDGNVDRLWLEYFARRAEVRARAALEPFGFYGARVTTMLEGNEKTGYLLLVTVLAGEPVRLTKVEVELRGAGKDEPLLLQKSADFPLRNGDVLLQELYEKAKADMLATARELGYLDAEFAVHEIRVDSELAEASIHLVMSIGPRYLFGEATIEGATYYPEELLRRYISFATGDVFSYKTLGKTQINFAGSSYFKSVSVVPDKEAAVALQVPVAITVVPAPRRTIRPGIGYGTDTGTRGSIGYKDLSLFYPGHILGAELTVAERLQGIAAAYTIPSHQNIETFTAIQLNLQQESVNDARSKLASVELTRTAGFGDSRLGSAFIRLLYEQYQVGLEGDNASALLLPGLRFSQRRYDDLIRPANGWHFALETRGSFKSFISDATLVQILAESGAVMPLPSRFSLHGRIKGGATLLDDPFTDLPASLRFFAGGDNSVRGYSYKSLGPRDASGEVIGGRNLLQGSIDLERALFNKWAVSLFYDAGNAFNAPNTFRLYQGAGVGLHYVTPIGSVNVSLARPLDVPDPQFRIHFTIGFQL